MIQNVLVLGAGSAGLLAALSLRRKIPDLSVRVVRSPEIGVIGVGEGTTPNFPRHLFDYLGLGRRQFYDLAQPTWKLGIRFLWGPRGHFHYGFGRALDAQCGGLPRPNGFYCDETFRDGDLPTALMTAGKVFARQGNGGGPDVQNWHGFHIENRRLVTALEAAARGTGVEITDGEVCGVEKLADQEGVRAVTLADGQRLEADFFVDASGFRSELLGRALAEPFVPYDRALFCDRAVVGGWERGPGEPILPYTTAETMDHGWAWQIEHEHHVNRGYVFSSDHVSDEDARAEFLRRNPRAPADVRTVRFRSGRYRRGWVGNVVAVGNAAGFVEPLEATALMVVCSACQTLADTLLQSARQPTPGLVDLYNWATGKAWDEIRDFLALHYRLNTRLDTPFWRRCRAETDLAALAEMLDFYVENGPTGFLRHLLDKAGRGLFGLEGWLAMLVGNRVPYRAKHAAAGWEQNSWERHCGEIAAVARQGLSIPEALAYVRHPGWRWHNQS